jgi:hypothetical protein
MSFDIAVNTVDELRFPQCTNSSSALQGLGPSALA